MKLAITGKGGVGKTTLASLLARLYAQEGYPVLAIDADPNANLASALGFPAEVMDRIVPISEMKDLIEERTGARPGTFGAFFKLNPRVNDIPEQFSATHAGVKLLVMGTVKKGGSGCVCPENVLLKNLVSHLLLDRQEIVIMDMEAGIEHLGRGTAQSTDALLIVVEPGLRSLHTAETIRPLADDIGIPRCLVVGSKVKDESDRSFIKTHLPTFEVIGFLSYSDLIVAADLKGLSPFDLDPNAVAEADQIRQRLDRLISKGQV
ncbi:MAG: carbon monoxide dehydrogenase accessory protein CooC [Chloroflexi bacterium]|nr:carbon monoxide dehydrogenase accessory protein CooC [Chloroflexota bacterium]MCL5074710.1 carbon monoxide dehydrogenase accessory protein CooC [Chloroflexota bacterium]